MRKVRTKRILVSRVRALAPSSTTSALIYIAVALFAAYVACVILTVYYASLETTLTASIRENENAIVLLEDRYYDGVAKISEANPYGEGYVTPSEVRYVALRTSDGLSLAGR